MVLLALALLPTAAAHGDLEINELETLIIRDFEGQEDSFAWEGWDIWDVYVGEGYNDTLDSDGVYFKVNLGGDGTVRPTGGAIWSLTFTYDVGDESFEREIAHDGTDVTTTFESLQWQVADGNVFQVKGWAPVANWTGKALTNVVIVASVDGSPRDTAPGGVHDPATGTEIPVQAPSTVVFPPIGEGRIVDEVPLTGPAKYLELAVEPKGSDTFTLTVTNPLAEQGQHVMLDASPTPGWELVTASAPHSLDGGKSATFDVQLVPKGEPGTTLDPYAFGIVTDIGGHRALFAALGATGVTLVEDPALATASTIAGPARGVPLPAWTAVLGLAGLALLARRR